MLRGESIVLRTVREDDLDELYGHHLDIDNRGDFFPRAVAARPAFFRRARDTGFWNPDDGMLVIASPDDRILGHIEFFKTVAYLDEYELSYQVYATPDRRRGAATQAVLLLTRYLFETKRVNRIRLIIHPDNATSRRLAERCGFRHEGTARGAWFHRGTHHDVEVYAVVRSDVLPYPPPTTVAQQGEAGREAPAERP
jgi:[ribosomal protein S5]-alanine N-acetyltransferase